MKKIMITAVVLAGLFGGQQAVAKSSTKHAAANKKHKKHHKNAHAGVSTPATTVGTATS